MTKKEKTRIQKEIVDSLDENPHGRLILAPRVGKSKIIIDLIKRDKPKSILWVTPSSKLADEDIPEEFAKWRAKRYIKKLTTTTWASLNKIKGVFDLVILDEEQFITENNSQSLFEGILYTNIVSMTGTPTKHQDKIDIYKRLGLDILIDMSINDAVDIGLLANYEINVLEVPLSHKKDIQVKTKKHEFMTSEFNQYNYADRKTRQAIFSGGKHKMFAILQRMRLIKDSPSKLKVAKNLINRLEGRKLIFSSSIKQAENLSHYTYHSKTDNKDLKKFQAGEVDTLALVNSGGTGFTYKEIDHLIMTQVDSDKNGLTSQKISRTLLQQKNYKATIWVLVLKGTQDEKWVESTLNNFDKTKINYIRCE